MTDWQFSSYEGGWNCIRDGHGNILVKATTATDNQMRLIVAACNSYDRHFGEHAVEAAETDMLEYCVNALWAIAHSADEGGQDQLAPDQWKSCREIAEAVLARFPAPARVQKEQP